MIPGLISRGRRWRMYYELYIDVFFLENLMMDSLILLALDHILKCGGKRGCIFLCAALGSLLTCAAVAAPLPGIAKLFLFHVCINSVMLITGLKIKSISQFVKAFILLYVVSVFMGGIMQIFRPYMRVVSLFYCAAFGSYLLLIRMWKLLSHEAERQRTVLEVTLYTSKGERKARALWDTGNRLRDFVTDAPVNILDPGILCEITDLPEAEKGFHLIPYRCIAGEQVMKVFRIEKMCVHAGRDGGDRWIQKPLFGVGEERLSQNKEYEIILNPGILSS